MNSINIAGRVIDDPIKTTSASGLNMARFKIAVDKNSKSDNGYDVFEVVVFKELANMPIEVGQCVGVTGKLTANNYEKDGKSYYNCSIVGNNVCLLSSKG